MSAAGFRLLLLSPTWALGCLLWGLVVALSVVLVLAVQQPHRATMVVSGGALALLFAFIHFAKQHRWARLETTAGSHGTARWGHPRALVRPDGLILGRHGRDLLRYAAEGHILTVAPTGSGKGVSAVIPNLLDYPGSVFVVDPKGENHAVTAPRRARFGRVVTLDPFRLAGDDTDAFNPLDLIDPDSELCDADAAALAHLLVLPSTEGDSAFWDDEAAALLSGLILFVAATQPAAHRHLGTVRDHLTRGPEDWQSLLRDMAACGRAHGLIARAANRLAQKADRERSGVVSTAQRHSHFLDSPAILRTLTASSFNPAQLKTETLSVYCTMPPERLGSHGRWLRLLAGSTIHAMLRTPGLPPHRVLLLLDEFAELGRLQPVEQALTLLRGYGVRLWLLVQDFAQIRATYRQRADSILANVAVLQSFGTSDLTTAEYLSRKTGQTTVTSGGENRSTGHSYGRTLLPTQQRGQAHSTNQTGRPLLTPDEVMRLDPAQELIFLSGTDPLLVDRVDYLRDREFRGLFAPNPMHQVL
ncbi:MAG TPA: type IV secretory system conjugative DNA transfer family protein [Thermoanaerobaculia bacterium]|nr:type IV secretory system conjugative DNA transfer family protein [Thermoanaerobaculia bacterium]